MGKKKNVRKPKNTARLCHKYLNDIGIKSDEICIFNTIDNDNGSERLKRFQKERKEYSFDSRETWALGYTLAGWLYSHLKMYVDIGGKIVDLTFYNFDIPVLHKIPEEQLEFESERYRELGWAKKFYEEKIENHTQLQCINIACEYLEYYLKNSDKTTKKELRANEKLRGALRIIAEIASALWW